MRYFIHLAYNGADYAGWQRQPHALAVQQELEDALSLMLGVATEVVGCGRTDAGVHASNYVAHFDAERPLPEDLHIRLNKFLPPSIAIFRIEPVASDLHARFHAHYRAYVYHLNLQKDPFRQKTSFYYPRARLMDQALVQQAAALLLEYDAFLPFCKTGSDAKTMHCTLYRSEWIFGETSWEYHIAANRFLRGMVRLAVGMCLNVGSGQIDLQTVRLALNQQERLKKSWSVGPEGLFLREIRYDHNGS